MDQSQNLLSNVMIKLKIVKNLWTALILNKSFGKTFSVLFILNGFVA